MVNKAKKFLPIVLLILITIILGACSSAKTDSIASSKSDNIYEKITAEKVKQRIDSGEPITILDVRTKEEFDEKHIEGAILIPNEEIGNEPPSQLPDKNAEILIYCRSGNRSRQAAEKLISMGYTNVKDFGGINDWSYDTVK